MEVKEWRLHFGLTQTQAAKLIGYSNLEWSNWECGNNLPPRLLHLALSAVAAKIRKKPELTKRPKRKKYKRGKDRKTRSDKGKPRGRQAINQTSA